MKRTSLHKAQKSLVDHPPPNHEDLRALNNSLQAEVSKLKNMVETLREELNLVNNTNHLLNQEVQKVTLQCEYFRNASYKYSQGINKILPVMEGLRDMATFNSDGSF